MTIADLDLDTSWKADAACRGLNPDMFFPERGEPTDAAKAVCATCTVRQDCLDYALTLRETEGIWGGTSERQRRHLRPRKGRWWNQHPDLAARAADMIAAGASLAETGRAIGLSREAVRVYAAHLRATAGEGTAA